MNDVTNEWPDYDALAAMLSAANTPFSAAYVHGMMSGLLCTDLRSSESLWKVVLDGLPAVVPMAAENELLNKLFTMTAKHLQEAPGAMQMVLPEDEAALSVRLKALSEWCDGYLEGIALENAGLKLDVVQEVLADLAKIKEVVTKTKSSKENEASYVEIVEFIKVAILLVYEECHPHKGSEGALPLH